MTGLKPIETRWKGYRFRSRLEARWAVFLDALGVSWEYEPEGFDLDGLWYLPDFRLPDQQLWLEIKPAQPRGHDLEKVERFEEALQKARAACLHEAGTDDCMCERFFVHVLVGEPWAEPGGRQSYVAQTPGYSWAADDVFIDCLICGYIQIGRKPFWSPYHDGDVSYFCGCCDWGDCRNGRDARSQQLWNAWFHKGDIHAPGGLDPAYTPRLQQAYRAARSARFEHEERDR